MAYGSEDNSYTILTIKTARLIRLGSFFQVANLGAPRSILMLLVPVMSKISADAYAAAR